MVDPSRGKPSPSSRALPGPRTLFARQFAPWKSYTLTELWKSDLMLYLSLSLCTILPESPAYYSSPSRALLASSRSSLAIPEAHLSFARLVNVIRPAISRLAIIFPLTFTPFSFRPSLPSPIPGNYTRTRTGSLKWRKNSRVSLQAIIRLPLSLLSRITFYPVQSSGTQ